MDIHTTGILKPKKSSIIILEWLDDLEIMVINKKKAFMEFIEINGLENDPISDDFHKANGSVAVIEVEDIPFFVFIFPTNTVRVIVHESVHMAQAIMDYKGIPINKDTGEVLAYLTDFLYTKLTEIL